MENIIKTEKYTDRYEIKVISGLEKCFMDQKISDKKAIEKLSMLANERLSFQVAYVADTHYYRRCAFKCHIEVESPIKENIKMFTVEQVAVKMPVYKDQCDDDYLRKQPGLYPDLLLPFDEKQEIIFVQDELRALFVTVENQEGIEAGLYPIKFKMVYNDTILCETEIEIEVIGKKLGELDMYHTEWFHTDCLASYYDCEVWSDKHWEIIDNYMKEAVRSGVNLLLTPVFTPPLDTLVGGERLTTQLVDVNLINGEYSFGYDRFDKWVGLCKKNGVKYYEINHLFTQWGAEHAPKIVANVDGEMKKIFGWETEAWGAEYSRFLECFLPDFIAHAKELGIDKDCFYHISDEPKDEHLENYKKARSVVKDLLKGYTIIDALSTYEIYEAGAVDRPIPANSKIEPFLEHNVPDLWVYYCCSQNVDVSNRFVAMPGQRIRIMGAQMYKFDIKGFLHWGFNFYNSRYSIKLLNPYNETCGEYFTPAGDCFLVYPAPNGTAYTSLHCQQFYMALEDHKALKLCESIIGKEKTMALVEEGIEPMTFKKYPKTEEYILSMRERINNAIRG